MTEEDLLLLMYQQGIGVGYVVDCETYELKTVNPPMLKVIGEPLESWHGKTCYEFIYKEKKPCSFCRMLKTQVDETARWHHPSPLHQQVMLMRSYKLNVNNETVFVQLSYPIPKEMEELQHLTAKKTAVQFLSACGKHLLESEGSGTAILQELSQFYGGTGGYLLVKNKETGDFHYNSSYFSTNQDENNQRLEKSTLSFHCEERIFVQEYHFFEEEAELANVIGKQHFITKRFHKNILLATLLRDEEVEGLLVVENLSENFHELHLITTILGFLNNYFFNQRHVHQLELQQQTCDTVLSCVKTLVSEDEFSQAMHKLLGYLIEYFKGERGFLMENMGNHLEITVANEKKETMRDSKYRLDEHSLEHLTKLFDKFGDGDYIFIESLVEKMDSTSTVREVLQEDGVKSILGLRLYKGKEISFFLIVENPSNHENRDILLKSVRKFVESYLIKDSLQKKLEQLSYTDGLTGLYNRNYFQKFADSWREESTQRVGVLFADVNGLKKVNDNFGHDAGNVLIRWAGLFLQKNTSHMKDAFVIRLAGDEFICVLQGVEEEEFSDIKNKLDDDMKKQGENHISFGYFWSEKSNNLEEAVQRADASMYESKQAFYKEQARDERSVSQSLADLKVELGRLNEVLEGRR